MNRKRRTSKQQARFDQATARAAREAQDRHARLEAARLDNERIERIRWLAAQPVRFDDYWRPAEIHGNLYVLGHLSEYFTAMYGCPEVFN